MKYIIISHRIADIIQEIPIVFPSNLVHEIVTRHITKALEEHNFKNIVCVRAGDCMIEECVTGGKSSTLNLEGEKEDHVLIELNDVLHGIVG